MTESETEAETIERLETALRKIAAYAPRKNQASLDRQALAHSLDLIIARLRNGLTSSTQGATPPE